MPDQSNSKEIHDQGSEEQRIEDFAEFSEVIVAGRALGNLINSGRSLPSKKSLGFILLGK